MQESIFMKLKKKIQSEIQFIKERVTVLSASNHSLLLFKLLQRVLRNLYFRISLLKFTFMSQSKNELRSLLKSRVKSLKSKPIILSCKFYKDLVWETWDQDQDQTWEDQLLLQDLQWSDQCLQECLEWVECLQWCLLKWDLPCPEWLLLPWWWDHHPWHNKWLPNNNTQQDFKNWSIDLLISIRMRKRKRTKLATLFMQQFQNKQMKTLQVRSQEWS